MAEQTSAIGPWPQGINNVDDPKSSVFQVPNDDRRTPPSLTKATNVDLDRGGFVKRRVGRTKRIALTNAHSLYVWGERLFFVDEGVLYEALTDYTTIERGTGLGNDPVSYAPVAGNLLYSNSTKVGAVEGFWGINLPSSPFITPGTGNFRAGRYLVAVTAVRDGVESGARQPVVFELGAVGGMTLDVVGIDLAADALNVYCTEPNGRELYFAGQFAPISPINLAVPPEGKDPLTTFGHYPPVPAQHIMLFRGRMVLAVENVLYWSQPLAYHHFRLQTDVQLFDDRIVLLAALDSGFFVGTANRTYWVSGADPEEWQPRVVDTRRVAEGEPLRVPAQKLPSLQSQGEVLVWATEDGFVAGVGDGSVRHLTDGRLAIDAYKQSALSYREVDGIRQILLNLQTKQANTLLGATDRMSVKVIRANESVGEP